mmetsp:Transcript_44768/g.106277  ORF Transcript_44768/g.106277 Transcript_44768/m.106277 type:complete len:240 (-) Transcript_44768:201-920(-)
MRPSCHTRWRRLSVVFGTELPWQRRTSILPSEFALPLLLLVRDCSRWGPQQRVGHLDIRFSKPILLSLHCSDVNDMAISPNTLSLLWAGRSNLLDRLGAHREASEAELMGRNNVVSLECSGFSLCIGGEALPFRLWQCRSIHSAPSVVATHLRDLTFEEPLAGFANRRCTRNAQCVCRMSLLLRLLHTLLCLPEKKRSDSAIVGVLILPCCLRLGGRLLRNWLLLLSLSSNSSWRLSLF